MFEAIGPQGILKVAQRPEVERGIQSLEGVVEAALLKILKSCLDRSTDESGAIDQTKLKSELETALKREHPERDPVTVGFLLFLLAVTVIGIAIAA